MLFQLELALKQPTVERILRQALTQKRLAHAYLFVGSDQNVKLKTALLLAQSLVCPEKTDVWACEKCATCQRVSELNYGDLAFIDGSSESIKKETVLKLQQNFNQTALEVANQKIYIIKQAENATVEALNSLLKFMEDPISQQVTGILIAPTEQQLLPTIVSRCQTIKFRPHDYQEIYTANLAVGMSNIDAYFLSKLTKDRELSQDLLEQLPYVKAKECLLTVIELYPQKPNEALVEVQRNLFTSKDKNQQTATLQYFLNLLIILFQDCLLDTALVDEWWHQQLLEFRQLPITHWLTMVLNQQRKVNQYHNSPLLIDQLFFQMQEARKHGTRI